MPYIREQARKQCDEGDGPYTEGELNYLICKLCLRYLEPHWDDSKESPTYSDYNAVIGALECAKLEIYRRLVTVYEEKKIKENGDIF